MGNCMFCSTSSSEKTSRVIIFQGGEMELKAWTAVKKITRGAYSGYKVVQHEQPYSPLAPNAKLQGGGVYYHLVCPKVVRRRVKIVMTRQQLEVLKQRAINFKCKAASVVRSQRSVVRSRTQWQPFLSAIPEMHNY